MSKMLWTVRHIPTLAMLPEKLERGRAYFVDDEQYIVIDFGRGPITYGGKPGPAGAAGEPIPSLEGKIENLAEASARLSRTLKRINDMRIRDSKKLAARHEEDIRVLGTEMISSIQSLRERHDNDMASVRAEHYEDIRTLSSDMTAEIHDLQERHNSDLESANLANEQKIQNTSEGLQRIITDYDGHLQKMINNNSEAIMKHIAFCYHKFEQLDKRFSIVVKLLALLYPNADIDTEPFEPPDINYYDNLTAGEILNTETGSYIVRRSYVNESDGSVIVILDSVSDSETEYVNTLTGGEVITVETGERWIVQSNKDGVIVLIPAGESILLDTLKQGDFVEYNGMKYTVSKITSENGQGEISLILSE